MGLGRSKGLELYFFLADSALVLSSWEDVSVHWRLIYESELEYA